MALGLTYSRPIRLLVALALVIAVGATALTPYTAYSATWPDCTWGCTANDVTINRVYLGHGNGTELGPCNRGGNVTAYVWAEFQNNTASNRYAVWLIFDLWINGSLANSTIQCDIDTIAPGPVSALVWGPMTWECGRTVTISNLIVSWVGTPDT